MNLWLRASKYGFHCIMEKSVCFENVFHQLIMDFILLPFVDWVRTGLKST